MKNSTVKPSEPKNLKTFNTSWTRTAIFIIALFLPAGAVAQSTPNYDQASHQQEAETNWNEGSYQQESAQLYPEDFSNPYQQPVITQFEKDQVDQARWSLGVPPSRRPQFNSFFAAEERAKQSREEKRREEEFELQQKLSEADLKQREQNLLFNFQ